MGIELITGPAHAGKARAVLELLREHHARGRRALLVVPTRRDTDRFARELADAGLESSTRVVRFDGLLAEAIRRAGSAEPALAALARERLLVALTARARGAPRAGGPGPVSTDARALTPAGGSGAAWTGGRGLTRALGAFVGELRVARVSPPRLREALAAWVAAEPAARARAERLGALYEDYDRALQELGRSDPEQRAIGALDTLRRTPARWGSTPVALYGFDDFTRLQLDAIETLGAIVGADVAVAFAFERGRIAFAGRARTFQSLLAFATDHRELGPRVAHRAPEARAALVHLERNLFESAPAAPAPAEGAVRLLEGGGERAELELVAEEIAALLARGVPAEEIAVVHRAPASIAELLAEVFAARRIPHALRRRVRFADTAIGGALLGALHAACEPDAELEHLLRWLRACGEHGGDAAGAHDGEHGGGDPGDALDTLAIADALEARARRAGVATVKEALTLWDEAWPAAPPRVLAKLREAAGASTAALVQSAARELTRLAARSPLPEISDREAQALQAARTALEELVELAHAPPSAAVPALVADAATLISTLRGLELSLEAPATSAEDWMASPRAPGAPSASDASDTPDGGTVAVLDPLELRARPVRALFACGLQEGVFPASPRAQPLLAEEERRQLVESSGLLALADHHAGADPLAGERHLFYAAVSRPRELLALSWHAADDDGLPRSRSLFVDDVCDLFACDLQGARIKRALGEVGEGGVGSARPVPLISPLRDERVLEELGSRRLWSASALEAWAGCPVRWFVERLLGERDLDPEPEPLARGALAHAALRDVLEGLRRETGSARLRPAVLQRSRELLGAALAEHEHEHPLSVAPERVPGARRRLRADLERYLEHAAERESTLEPTHLELSFGFEEEPDGLPALALEEGVAVRGRIDRVDVDPKSGAAVVYDYTGARAPDGARWARERSFQIPLYMRALQDAGTHVVGGFYQPLSGRDLRARGAVEVDGVELECVRGDAYEPDELRALLQEALAQARAAAAEARAGRLEPRAATCGFGESGCMYPEICRCES